MIYIGTSGYSYDDWIGPFYEQNIKKGDMLLHYSKIFNFTEINSTYYKMPNRFMFFNMAKKTQDEFKFTIKLHGSMTHLRNADNLVYNEFNESLKPLIESNKLGCLVAQFPYSFHKSQQNMDYLKRIRENFKDIKLCVEFRNQEWMCKDVYNLMSDEELGFVCVDEPNIKGLIKPLAVVTSDIGYIRFHGRNSEKWYKHNEAYERYNYLYSQHELKEWMPNIKFVNENSKSTFIAFNNHFRAQGAVNASMLQRLLSTI